MPNKLLLIDGQSLIWQTNHKLPQKIEGKNGQSIEEIWWITKILQKMLEEVKPTHLLVLFEKEWKDNQKKEWLLAILEELALTYVEATKESIPALIQTYCHTYQADSEITIGTASFDYFNLVTNRIKVLSFKNGNCTWYTKEKILNKWKVNPEFFADYIALVGDEKNSISGIPRIGPKLAAELINEYGHIEQILENRDRILKDNVRLTLEIFQNDLLTNIELIRFPKQNLKTKPLEEITCSYHESTVKELLKKVNLL